MTYLTKRIKTAPSGNFPIFLLGALSGIALFVGLLFCMRATPKSVASSLSFNSTDFATLLAGFGGAIIGGVVSWMLAIQGSKETLRRDAEQRTASDKTLVLGVVLKVQLIANAYYTQRKYLWDALTLANAQKRLDRPLWELVKPQIGYSHPRPRFEAPEFVPFVVFGRADIIDRCTQLSLRYDVLEASFETYSEKRGRLQELLAPFSDAADESGIATTVVPEGEHARVRIMINELEDLLLQIRNSVREDFVEATALCKELMLVSRDMYEGESLIELETSAF